MTGQSCNIFSGREPQTDHLWKVPKSMESKTRVYEGRTPQRSEARALSLRRKARFGKSLSVDICSDWLIVIILVESITLATSLSLYLGRRFPFLGRQCRFE